MAATQADVSAKLDTLIAAEAQKAVDVTNALNALKQQIADLQAAGADLQPLADKVDSAISALGSIPTA